METVEVVDKHLRLAEPLTVMFSPGGFSPSGITDGKMQLSGLAVEPPAGGEDVSERIGMIVNDHLGIAGGSAAEKHQHRIAHFVFRRTRKHIAVSRQIGIKGCPALFLSVDAEFEFE